MYDGNVASIGWSKTKHASHCVGQKHLSYCLLLCHTSCLEKDHIEKLSVAWFGQKSSLSFFKYRKALNKRDVCMYVWLPHAKSCPTLCDPLDYSWLGSSVHGIFQARILEWVAVSSSRGSFWPRDWTCVSCDSWIAGGFFTTEPSWKSLTSIDQVLSIR